MKGCSRKHVNYFDLKVIKAFNNSRIKPIQFDGKVVNWVFNLYPKFEKCYELWEVKSRG